MRGPALLLALGFAVLARHARAEGALPLELEWEAPPGCASGEEIRSELARIARVRPGRTVAPLRARGRIERAGTSFRLSLHTEQNGQAGERTLVAGDCRTLEREVTLVLAVAFGEGVELVSEKEAEPTPSTPAQRADAEASESRSPAEEAPQPPVTPPPAVQEPPRDVSSSQKDRLGAAVLAGGGALLSTLPSPAGFVTAGATLGTARLWLDARLLWIPGVEQTLTRGVQARYQGFGGSLSGCAAVPSVSALSACVSFLGAALAGRSTGATESLRSVAPFFSVAPVIGWQWPSNGTLRLRIEASLHVALNEPQFVVVGLGKTHEVPLLSPSLDAILVFSPSR